MNLDYTNAARQGFLWQCKARYRLSEFAGLLLAKQACFVIWLWMPLVLLDFNGVAVAQETKDLQFAASGVVDSQYYSGGILTDHLTNEFTCYVSNGRYSMFLTASNPKDKQATSFECLFDGTNTYFTKRLSTNLVTTVVTISNGQFFEHQLAKPATRNNNAILQITEGSMPSTENQAVVLVWLCLGSIVDLGEVLEGSQSPLTFLGKVYRDQHIKLKAASKAHEGVPGFLEWREDYHEGNLLTGNHGALKRTPLIGPLSLGYTNSIYNVTAWTNVIGMSFPEEAQLSIFFPSEDLASVECRIVCSIKIGSIQLGIPDTQFSPVIAANTTVNDRRQENIGRNAEASYYLTLDGGLLSQAQLASGTHYRVTPRQPDNIKANPYVMRYVFLVIFGLLLVMPLVLLIYHGGKKNKQK